jgi:dolichyl-phosphate mannosyltransferase polypeptide 2 regulatory subunit
MSSRGFGLGLVSVSVGLFLYYSFWVLVTPFIDTNHWLQSYFPDRSYALVIPTLLCVVAVSIVSSFVALVMIRSSKPKQN